MGIDDPKLITDLASLGAAAWASKELAGKLLGPTFEYIGGEVRNFARKCNINLTDVFQRARRKAEHKLDEPGGVSARVFKDVVDQGAFCDEPLAAEYVAGVLAASRSEDSRDDRGVGYLAVIREMSSYELRLHYLFYWSIKSLLNGKDLSALNIEEAPHMRMFLSMQFLRENCCFRGDDHVITQQALNGLARHNLIDAMWWGGDENLVRANEPSIQEPGYFATPTGFGSELFLWAHGYSDNDIASLLSADVVIQPLPDLSVKGQIALLNESARSKSVDMRPMSSFAAP